MCFSLSISSKYHALVSPYLSNIVVPPEDLTLLSFISVIQYFGSQLESWPNGIINHYILETDMLHYPITIYLPSRFTVQFTTLSHFYYHIHRLHHYRNNISTLSSRIKPCAYRVPCFSNGYQNCHYYDHYDPLIIEFLFSHKKYYCSTDYI